MIQSREDTSNQIILQDIVMDHRVQYNRIEKKKGKQIKSNKVQ